MPSDVVRALMEPAKRPATHELHRLQELILRAEYSIAALFHSLKKPLLLVISVGAFLAASLSAASCCSPPLQRGSVGWLHSKTGLDPARCFRFAKGLGWPLPVVSLHKIVCIDAKVKHSAFQFSSRRVCSLRRQNKGHRDRNFRRVLPGQRSPCVGNKP